MQIKCHFEYFFRNVLHVYLQIRCRDVNTVMKSDLAGLSPAELSTCCVALGLLLSLSILSFLENILRLTSGASSEDK